MLPNTNPIVVALATAYCALAAPTNTHTDRLREFIDSLKVHLEADNIDGASEVISDAEASLRTENSLNEDVLANLRNQIQVRKRPFIISQPPSHLFTTAACSSAGGGYINVARHLLNINLIQTLTTEEGVTVDTIAKETIEYLNSKGAIKKPDQDEAADGAIYLDADVIKQVLDHGVNFMKLGPCPDGSQADLCCIIL